MREVLNTIAIGLVPVVVLLVSWASQRLIAFLNTKISKMKSNEYMNSALNVISDVVKEVYQTYVSNIKDTEEWNEESKKIALDRAIETIQTLLSNEIKDYINANFSSLDSWLLTQTEAKIYDLKKTN